MAGIGACPGPTTNALSTEGGSSELPKLVDMLETCVAITGEVNEGTGRAEVELVVAGTDRNVDTNAGNLNVSEEAANEPATTIAELEQTLVENAGGALDSDTMLSRIATMMVSSE